MNTPKTDSASVVSQLLAHRTVLHWVSVKLQLGISVKDPRSGWALLTKVTPFLFLENATYTATAATIKQVPSDDSSKYLAYL